MVDIAGGQILLNSMIFSQPPWLGGYLATVDAGLTESTPKRTRATDREARNAFQISRAI